VHFIWKIMQNHVSDFFENQKHVLCVSLTWGAFFNSKSESCFRMRIPIPRFIINVKIMILNQGNRRSSMLQFETKMASCVLYRSHLWNNLKWITTFGAFYMKNHAKSCFRFFWKSETCFMWNKNVVIHFKLFQRWLL
jgi:L-lactate utilization protein LutB